MKNKPKKTTATIMIVDDSPTNLSVLIDYLYNSGFKILIANDGESALTIAQRGRPDLILLDIMMPGMNGYETCQCLKQDRRTKDIPVIFISALSKSMDKVKGFSVGGVDYITKPFQQDEVLARVTTHLTIQRQKKDLAKLNATKDKFFSIISHDMRGIFTPIAGASDIISRIAEKYDDARLKKFSGMMVISVRIAVKLFENLLEWSRTQQIDMPFEPSNVSLTHLVNETMGLFQEHQKSKNIHIINDIIDDDLQVYVDDNMVKTIVRNLLSNALKFTPSGGKITLKAIKVDDFIEVSVSDNGIGINSNSIDKLFLLQNAKSNPGTDGEKGTGLGLILCKEFVEKNGGQIFVNSSVHYGTTVGFTLPEARKSP
ncbi:MAG: hybrid sensor histidine kinase/response regulator [Candidatus Magnetomorum sp.]|nr:hybrid sensor histidine kinase/response regulator [Candidatus Magnetomorum sp.]